MKGARRGSFDNVVYHHGDYKDPLREAFIKHVFGDIYEEITQATAINSALVTRRLNYTRRRRQIRQGRRTGGKER